MTNPSHLQIANPKSINFNPCVRDRLGKTAPCVRSVICNHAFDVITIQRDSLIRAIHANEWDLLHQVNAQKAVIGEDGYQTLLRSLFVFEYRDEQGSWFGLNPILAEANQLG
jgi:hypothetical protein